MEVEAVRRTCAMVMGSAKHVTLGDDTAFSQTASRLAEMISHNTLNVDWDADGWHYHADAASMGPLTAQYILVLDALNWCFWPSSTGMEYEHLACALKHVLADDHHAFDADRLQAVTPEQLRTWFAPQDVPELEERAEKLREVRAARQQHPTTRQAHSRTRACRVSPCHSPHPYRLAECWRCISMAWH